MKIDMPLELVRVVFKLPNGETVIFDNQVSVPAIGELVSIRVSGIAVPVEGYVSLRHWSYEGITAVMIILKSDWT